MLRVLPIIVRSLYGKHFSALGTTKQGPWGTLEREHAHRDACDWAKHTGWQISDRDYRHAITDYRWPEGISFDDDDPLFDSARNGYTSDGPDGR